MKVKMVEEIKARTPKEITALSPVPVRPAAIQPICPECRQSDRVEKVSNVVRQGAGIVYLTDATIRAFLSDLARILSSPRPPVRVSFASAAYKVLASYGFLAAILFGLSILNDSGLVEVSRTAREATQVVAVVLLGVILPLGIAGTAFVGSREYAEAFVDWQDACDRWRLLYYCERDDCIFFPDSEVAHLPEQMHEVIGARASIS